MSRCAHADTAVSVTDLPAEVAGCEDCLAVDGKWVHLRICLECGHVGCCDSSPAKHATAHHHATGHPIMRSIEPGEAWAWCFVDEAAMRLPEVSGEPRIPPSPLAP